MVRGTPPPGPSGSSIQLNLASPAPIGTEITISYSGALHNNTTAHYNTGLGDSALLSNTTGHTNTAVGFSALVLNTTGFDNTTV